MASFLRLSLLPAVSWNMAGGVFVIEQRKRRKRADDNGSLIGNWSTSSDSVHHACLDFSFPPKMRFIFAGGGKCVSFLQGAAAVQQDRFGYLARSLGTSHILFPAEIWSLRR